MRKLSTMIATCCLAALTLAPAAAACPKATDEAPRPATIEVAQKTRTCGKQTAPTSAVATETDEATAKALKLAVAALEKLQNCGAECPGRPDLVLAVRTLAAANPGVVCNKKVTALSCHSVNVASDGKSRCGSKAKQARTRTRTVASGKTCSKAKAAEATQVASKTCSKAKTAEATQVASKTCDPAACAKAKATQVAAGKTCDPAACSKAKATQVAAGKTCDPAACSKAKATQVAAGKTCDPAACAKAKATQVAASTTCSKAKAAQAASACCAGQARYVAFGCENTDRIARAAARAYLGMMRELKAFTGAEGCSAKAASQVLASVLENMQAEQAEQATQAAEAETDEAETQTVSMGAVGESKPACGATRN